MAWPGTRVLARFNGTGASVKLSELLPYYQGKPSWFNVIVDGVVGTPFSVSDADEDHVLAAGLALGDHTVEIEKRTEANHGTVRFQGFTFTGGTGLLPPPARPTKRIEFITESTADGFGVEGDRNVTCINSAPPDYDNIRKSVSFKTAVSLGAEPHFTSYSGKGIADTETGIGSGDDQTMPLMWTRGLPEPEPGTPFDTSKWIPQVVVLSLGGADYTRGVAGVQPDFVTKYDAFIGDLRAKYGASTYIYLTIWSQIKGADRTDLSTKIDSVLAGRAADTKLKKYVFPEADPSVETGCYYHAVESHHTAMATLLVGQIAGVVPGF